VIDDWVEACALRGLRVTSALSWHTLEPYLAHDKKQSELGLGWVLLDGPGLPVTEVRVPMSVVAGLWESHLYEPAAGVPALAAANGSTTAVVASARPPRVLVLFGVNLGQLGVRDTGHYGSLTLAELVAKIVGWGAGLGMHVECRQTDSLERFVAALHEARTSYDAVIVNPGAWTHHERALHDAIEPLAIPVVEYHLSDIGAREDWRHVSVLDGVVDHVVSGEGAEGARNALQLVANQLADANAPHVQVDGLPNR